MQSLRNIGRSKEKNVLKVIVDANVWVAALLNPGKPRDIQQRLKENRYQLFFAEPLLAELKVSFPPKSRQ